MKHYFWFYAIWALPFALIGALMTHSTMVMVAIWMMLFLVNVFKKYILGEDDFNPFHANPRKLSFAKRKAQNASPPRVYLSRKPDGLTVGRFGFWFVRLLFGSDPQHQLILGSSGAQKTTTLLNALIHSFNESSEIGSVLAVDCKPELSRKAIYEGRPDVKVINPTRLDRYGFDLYYGLALSSDMDEVVRRFTSIACTLIVNPGGDNSYFYEWAQNILTAFLAHFFYKGLDFSESINKITDVKAQDLIAEIMADRSVSPKIKKLLMEIEGDTTDAAQNIQTTLKKNLSIFTDAKVQHCFSRENTKLASPEDLANGTSIFLAVPEAEMDYYALVFRLIIQTCLRFLRSRDEAEIKSDKLCWFLIDEAGSIGPIPDLMETLARGRSKKVLLTIVCQAFSQLEEAYGRNHARTILSGVDTTIILSCSDVPLAREFSDRFGKYTEVRKTSGKSYSGASVFNSSSSTNESIVDLPIMDVSDIDALKRDKKVLVFAREGNFVAKKAPFYSIKEHKELSEKIAAENERFYRK